MTLWEIDVFPAAGQPNVMGQRLSADASDLGLAKNLEVFAAQGYLIEGELGGDQARRLARELLSDQVVEQTVEAKVGDARLGTAPDSKFQGANCRLIHVLPKPGVTDPVAQSALVAARDFGFEIRAIRTLKKYWIAGLSGAQLNTICSKLLANDSIEQCILGELKLERLQVGAPYQFRLDTISIRGLSGEQLLKLSRDRQLYMTLVELETVQRHFSELKRDPTDAELETIAQTWSEHCSHKTLRGRIDYHDEHGQRRFENLLKETIFAATQSIRSRLGTHDWCVSVFEDNAGIIQFDDEFHVVFKVETHNHPSAIEPYGGANTGIGGVIRDPMGTGLGAKPICNTNVFCFAPPTASTLKLPTGVLHPRRVMKGVVSGVRDYGNRMGIPTVNGAIYFDDRYLGNPLVFCGNVGLLPRNKAKKGAKAGDWIVSIGGRTGRDGIHGATFSSAELTSESESLSGGAVQIGNAITEKMMLDVLIQARDRGLYHAVTDCGAGGFSSAVGEMAADIGAEVWLDMCPLKYEGLSYTEIWISEAQERMVLAVPPESWDEFHRLCSAEGVEATQFGRIVPTNRLQLFYGGQSVADLSMHFLHEGRPPIVREARYRPRPPAQFAVGHAIDPAQALRSILGSLNVASKEWVIRQYDHEVQGGSVIKPLVGVANDGPSDAAVLRPVLKSRRGIAISCGMNPRYGDFDTYAMAASAIDEAIRNCVAVGADPGQIAILDNFCWGYTDRPETLGSLVRAALACHDTAIAFGTPFISGKDSLNNEFSYTDEQGEKRTISIPATLLISAIGQIDNVARCVTMDLKEPGNLLYVVGLTRNELGGSHYSLVARGTGGAAPTVDTLAARRTFERLHQAIRGGLIGSCHDLSEGGLAVSIAEMAFSGGWGARISIDPCPCGDDVPGGDLGVVVRLFSESNSRFICEVPRAFQSQFEATMAGVACGLIGEVIAQPELQVFAGSQRPTLVLAADLADLKQTWQAPLRW